MAQKQDLLSEKHMRLGLIPRKTNNNKKNHMTLPVPTGLVVYGGGGGTPGAMTLAKGTRPALLKAPKNVIEKKRLFSMISFIFKNCYEAASCMRTLV